MLFLFFKFFPAEIPLHQPVSYPTGHQQTCDETEHRPDPATGEARWLFCMPGRFSPTPGQLLPHLEFLLANLERRRCFSGSQPSTRLMLLLVQLLSSPLATLSQALHEILSLVQKLAGYFVPQNNERLAQAKSLPAKFVGGFVFPIGSLAG